jgi:molybdopterin converting factor small subunit
MTVTVEFYGIPRERAGVAEVTVPAARLRDVLAQLAAGFPRLSEACLERGRLRQGYVANVNGQRFVSDPELLLQPGDRLLILAADAGG